MTEYEYLRAFVMDRFHWEVEAQVNPLHDQYKLMVLQKNDPEAMRLLDARDWVHQELHIKRARAEEIISWLSLDNQLRRESTTYCDVREGKL